MFNKTNFPVVVVVGDNRYDCFTYRAPTFTDRFITNLIEKQGGISDTVEDGVYHANLIRNRTKVELTLERSV